MEGRNNSDWKNKRSKDDVEEPEERSSSIIEPETPMEPLEFLSRSWTLSAEEVSKALALKHKKFVLDHNLLLPAPHLSTNKTKNIPKRAGSIGKWFHYNKKHSNGTMKKKDKARVENARAHVTLSVAGLAAGLAAAAAVSAQNTNGSGSKMSLALASATELLASHCIELAESAGIDHDRVASVVRSAVNIRSPSDLVTLTAAAATALRGEAAFRSRLPRESKKNAAISPAESHHMLSAHPLCIGNLLQFTRKGVLRWKHVSIYINNKSQVVMKLKSKHVGGAFSKNKCVVYGVCNEASAWPFEKERENVEAYFGVKSGKGLVEFKCKNKIHKENWVNGIQNLLGRTNISYIEDVDSSIRLLNINKSID